MLSLFQKIFQGFAPFKMVREDNLDMLRNVPGIDETALRYLQELVEALDTTGKSDRA